jgi:hypothetical protein
VGVRILRGQYLVGGVPEDFACGAGPAGWRYAGVRADGYRVDLTLDAGGRPYRLELASADWLLRGGAAGADLLWVRGGAEFRVAAHGFFAESPAFWVALSRLPTGPVRVVEVTGPALATRSVDLRVSATPEQGTTRYAAMALDTGESRTAWLADDIVVAADGIELLDLARD